MFICTGRRVRQLCTHGSLRKGFPQPFSILSVAVPRVVVLISLFRLDCSDELYLAYPPPRRLSLDQIRNASYKRCSPAPLTFNVQDDYYDPYANPASSMKLDWTEPNASIDTSASTSKHSGVDAVDETDKMNTSDLNYDMQVRSTT